MIGQNLDFFTAHPGNYSIVVYKKTLSGVCCMKHACILSACWSHRIASSFVGVNFADSLDVVRVKKKYSVVGGVWN